MIVLGLPMVKEATATKKIQKFKMCMIHIIMLSNQHFYIIYYKGLEET